MAKNQLISAVAPRSPSWPGGKKSSSHLLWLIHCVIDPSIINTPCRRPPAGPDSQNQQQNGAFRGFVRAYSNIRVCVGDRVGRGRFAYLPINVNSCRAICPSPPELLVVVMETIRVQTTTNSLASGVSLSCLHMRTASNPVRVYNAYKLIKLSWCWFLNVAKAPPVFCFLRLIVRCCGTVGGQRPPRVCMSQRPPAATYPCLCGAT